MDTYCPGSRKPAEGVSGRRGDCPVCGKRGTLRADGTVRRHAPAPGPYACQDCGAGPNVPCDLDCPSFRYAMLGTQGYPSL